MKFLDLVVEYFTDTFCICLHKGKRPLILFVVPLCGVGFRVTVAGKLGCWGVGQW